MVRAKVSIHNLAQRYRTAGTMPGRVFGIGVACCVHATGRAVEWTAWHGVQRGACSVLGTFNCRSRKGSVLVGEKSRMTM